MVTIIITALVSSTVAVFGLIAIQSGARPVMGTKWRYDELVKLTDARTARQLWPVVCAGQLSLFDIKMGVYTVGDRVKMQNIWEAYHADLS